jgi:hypothetical protein
MNVRLTHEAQLYCIVVNAEYKEEPISYLSLKNISSPRIVVIASKVSLLSHTLGVWGPTGWLEVLEGPKENKRPGISFA